MREWLKVYREKAELSQEQVAEKAGISQQYYNFIETGLRGDKLPVQTAKKIASALGFEWTKFYDEKRSA